MVPSQARCSPEHRPMAELYDVALADRRTVAVADGLAIDFRAKAAEVCMPRRLKYEETQV